MVCKGSFGGRPSGNRQSCHDICFVCHGNRQLRKLVSPRSRSGYEGSKDTLRFSEPSAFLPYPSCEPIVHCSNFVLPHCSQRSSSSLCFQDIETRALITYQASIHHVESYTNPVFVGDSLKSVSQLRIAMMSSVFDSPISFTSHSSPSTNNPLILCFTVDPFLVAR